MAWLSEDYDAIAYMMMEDDGFTAERAEEDVASGKMMLADELETFCGRITPDVTLWVEEEHLKRGEPGGVTAFMFFKDAVAAAEAAHGCAMIGGASRVILNRRLPDTPSLGIASGLGFDSVIEVSAATRPALIEVLKNPHAAGASRAEIAIAAREAVLWDRISDLS